MNGSLGGNDFVILKVITVVSNFEKRVVVVVWIRLYSFCLIDKWFILENIIEKVMFCICLGCKFGFDRYCNGK